LLVHTNNDQTKTMQKQEQTFAYGCDSIGNSPCPAVGAGFTVEGAVLQAAEWYDSIARDRCDSDEGTLSEPEAKEVWLQVIDTLRNRANSAVDEQEYRYKQKQVEKAIEIRDELGW
jgi:hypothetical protein